MFRPVATGAVMGCPVGLQHPSDGYTVSQGAEVHVEVVEPNLGAHEPADRQPAYTPQRDHRRVRTYSNPS